ncbi:ABC transporter substrate-binding protein [Myceligenerans pegani]|uniref:Sugar ABC transporter substrate-binding protein n=1 Tax=Myceligenerans pegani TaxID=2776917 RepID=A0ABR9N2X8_9MICO|nr:sugar ABC transporter substrate-binding protein [Myceligenerans sp. TRM 65318]MBE1877631.1 sugar ABC transporter substrate-binding protein [Myceligenerans sp. TRM 65318]MBE3019902.1 sugar ABC transporter substrate-binding protein [Myceligenerans sp. TRM 65318]
MTRMARLGAGAAVGALAVAGLAACSAGGSGNGDADGSIEIWTRSAEESAASYQFAFDAFTEQTGIEIDYQPVQEFDTQLQARAQQGDLPDLFINDAGSLGNYVEQGLVLPVDPQAIDGGDQIPQSTWDENIGADGSVYGVPFSRQANITVVRRDWREALGIDAPETWEDLTALAEAFATEDPDGNGEDDTYGMVVPGSAQSGYIFRWGVPYIWQAGGDILQDNGDGTFAAVFDSPETVTAIEWIQEQFCTPGVVVPGSVNLTTADTPFFGEGTAGIYLTGPYNLSTFDNLVGRDNVEIVPMPAGPAGTTSFSEGENIYFGASSDKADLQRQLAEFLITPEAQELMMKAEANDAGVTAQPVVRIPVNENVDVGAVKDDERWNLVADAYADSKHFPWSIDFLPYRQIVADGMNAVAADCQADAAAGVSEVQAQLVAQLEADGLAG